MGAFAPAPFLDEALASRVRSEVFDRALAGIQAEGLDFRGVLYAGLMITPEGPKVLEFNVRFGDPEAQAVLPLVESDLLDLMEATARGRLETASISLRDASCVCVVLASEGYPGRPKTGRTIMGLRNIRDDDPDLMVFHAGTSHDGKVWRTSGGRVLGVTALGARLEEARFKAYDAVRRIRFAGMQFRRDIAETLPRP
jgi:phosphoribosylamine--glycine ligase